MNSNTIVGLIKGNNMLCDVEYEFEDGTGNQTHLLYFEPAIDKALTFSFLGGGTNKLVFRCLYKAQPLPWVFCFNQIPRSESGEDAIREELKILGRLAGADVAIPGFGLAGQSPPQNIIEFTLHNPDQRNDMGNAYGFVLEYLQLGPGGRYLEMSKVAGNLPGWMTDVINDAPGFDTPNFGNYVARTRETFNTIRQAWEAEPWGDFQVVYDRVDGSLIVFDPNGDLTSKAATDAIIASWGTALNV